jgi:hypothetical protein
MLIIDINLYSYCLIYDLVMHLSKFLKSLKLTTNCLHQKRMFSTTSQHPSKVGIVAMDTYFPKTFVSQQDLEVFDKVSKGKYQVGLSQSEMAFVDDREDMYSMALTGI